MANLKAVYRFLMAFKQDSGFLINNFLLGLSKDEIIKGQFEEFDYMTGDIDFFQWGDAIEYLNTINLITSMKKEMRNYWKIDMDYIKDLINFADFMFEQDSLNDEMIVYRGCNSLEVDGVKGLVSTTKDIQIAQQFNRGTLLKIHLPKGMKIVDIDKIRPKKSGDKEKEVILPPCSYRIASDKMINLKGPNNHSEKTRMVEIYVYPKDLLREFEVRVINPPVDYMSCFPKKITHSPDYYYFASNLDEKEENFREYLYAKELLLYAMLKRSINTFKKSSNNRMPKGTALYGRTGVLEKEGVLNKDKNATNFHDTFELLNSEEELPLQIVEFIKSKGIRINNQVKPRDFYNYIRRSKAKKIFSYYEKTDEHKKLYKSQEHGIRHVDNVSIFTYYIASKEGYSHEGIRFLMEAARNHDRGRTNDWEMGNHGFDGAEQYKNENVKKIPFSEITIEMFLILAHDLPRYEDVKNKAYEYLEKYLNEDEINILCDMAYILRDADALDRTRFPILSDDYVNCNLLTHDSAKELILVAQTLNELEKKKDKERHLTQEQKRYNNGYTEQR